MRVVSAHCLRVLVVAGLGAVAACRPAPSERELLVQATLLAEQGDAPGAEQAFAEALRVGGGSADLFARYAAFRLDSGNLDGAALLLDQAEQFEMTLAERRRLDDERVRWLRSRIVALEATHVIGADVTELLALYARLAALVPGTEAAQQWASAVVREVRHAMGCDAAQLCRVAEVDATRIDASAAARALRLARTMESNDDPRPMFSDSERDELRAVVALLERLVFEDGFATTFEAQRAAPMAAEGRWDAASREFVVRYLGPFGEGTRADSRPELILASAQSVLARQVVTQLAWDLRGQDPSDGFNLSMAPRDLMGVRATDLGVTPDGMLTFVLRIPWDVALRAAWMLEQRLTRDEAAPPP